MAQTLCTYLIWMFEVVWGRWYHQPQPWWHTDIISTPQGTLNSQIWGQLGQCTLTWVYGCTLVCPWDIIQMVQILFVYVLYGCLKWSIWIPASNIPHNDIIFTLQDSQIWGQLGLWNGIHMHPYVYYETAYQLLKHLIWLANMDVESSLRWISTSTMMLWHQVWCKPGWLTLWHLHS